VLSAFLAIIAVLAGEVGGLAVTCNMHLTEVTPCCTPDCLGKVRKLFLCG
jgi:hypothetical protein